jgi:hypothetical protein
MSKFDKLKVDELGLEFMNLDQVFEAFDSKKASKTNEDGGDGDNLHLTFGPSEAQLKSYDQWEDCDGQFFFPYNQTAKIGKVADVIADEQSKKYADLREKRELREA